ncbi:hypothetical protein K488DRAFT_81980 [Vararia minispora EC-137]|uniref:Uncharacterized protein n=1 Tax=Vararia minispora EC-137 TaxID=1314806 RepID=A0ACB8QYB1_9AGAM|nr:hypothetical protein K488DRAFT_81980 [Vararia minispora EC-137]
MAEPSAALADALKNITQATLTALRSYESQSRKSYTEMENDVRALRKERDAALVETHRLKQKDVEWSAEVDRWKAELEKVDIAHSHQSQLIDHLREEVQQWKDHCLRLEESSRLEVRDWKAQFMRADHERSHLTSRLNSLLPEACPSLTFCRPFQVGVVRLTLFPVQGEAGTYTASITPRSRTTEIPSVRKQNPLARASTSALVHPPLESIPLGSPRKPRPSTSTRAGTSVPAAPQTPGPMVVRRVHATFELPVKEEDEDGGLLEQEPDPAPHVLLPTKRHTTSGATPKSRTKRPQASDAENEDEDGSGEYIEGGDRTRRRRTAVMRAVQDESGTEDDEEDELAMGVEENPQEIYGQKTVSARARGTASAPRSVANATNGRKRKAAADAATAKTPAASRTKKRR